MNSARDSATFGICALCGSARSCELFQTKDRLAVTSRLFTIVKCLDCGVGRTLPEMSKAELADYYPSDYWGVEPTDAWIRRSQAEKTGFVKRCGLNGGRILDVGCGAGFFLRALDEQVWQRFGVEISNEAASQAREKHGDNRIIAGELTEARFPDNKFDLVTFWSALEHTDNPRQ